ncbi:MAG: preprotein translocase subunit SecG [Bacteroidales bacterium]|jgi:preprotein translocase subunit SecG|nr:preprotein translocase subunit SecG [Bacteroidales bacterium]
MYIAITIFVFIAAIFLIFIVLVQNSKGGGLASGFSASNQVMGVRKTTDFLEKGTWFLAGFMAILSIVATGFVKDNGKAAKESLIKEEVQSAVSVDPNLVAPDFSAQGEEAQAPETNE